MALTTSPLFDIARLEHNVDRLASEYRSALPFPHAVIDDFLQLEPDVITSFPDADWNGWRSLGGNYQFRKFFCQDPEVIPEPFSSMIAELSRPRFLNVLEAVTGIERLLPDPSLTGGGLHLSGPGGVLAPHTDFHVYADKGLFRRVNVLVYFNESWKESDGGCLELWSDDAGTKRSTVVPEWGRCVIFTTDDASIHGFPVPIAEGRWRRSLALYYYTAEQPQFFSGDTTTYWRTHGEQDGVRRVRLSVYLALLRVSRGFSVMAQLANPNQGSRTWWEDRKQRRRRGREPS